jgi:hypothetical protein
LRSGKPPLNKKKVELFLRQDHLPVEISRGLGKMGGFVETKGLTEEQASARASHGVSTPVVSVCDFSRSVSGISTFLLRCEKR